MFQRKKTINRFVSLLKTELTQKNEENITVEKNQSDEYYAEIVLDRATRRDLIKISSELKAESFDLGKESTALLDTAEQRIFALAERNETTVIHDARNIMIKEIEIKLEDI